MLSALIIYPLLLLLLAVVSAMETATFAVRDARSRISQMRAGRVKDELLIILANPFLHMHRTLVVSATLNLAITTLGMFLIMEPLRAWQVNPWLATLGLYAVTVLLGDVLPKFIAVRNPTGVLVQTTRWLSPVRRLLDPFAHLAERASDWLLQFFVPKRVKARQPITQDELETLIEMREEQKILDPSEAEMLQEILDIAELTVRDCMIPRVDLTLIEATDPQREIMGTLERSRSRFAILHGETPDTVLGIIDVPAWKVAGRPAWKEIMRSPAFVPETFPALEALSQHLTSTNACVLILDEYGGLEGMVTQEEITDWLLYDAAPWQGEADEFRETEPGRFIADGRVRVDQIAEELDIELDPAGIDTIGGLVFNHLGYLPKPGERCTLHGLQIKVRRVSRHRIQQVELRKA
jgi:putative hemolysin